MQGKRANRISALIKEHLASVLTSHMRDPRVGFATITHVEVSDDMKHAKVLYSVIGTPDQKIKAQEAMGHASGFFQKGLAEKLKLRFTPHLHFIQDNSLDQQDQISTILKKIHDQDQ